MYALLKSCRIFGSLRYLRIRSCWCTSSFFSFNSDVRGSGHSDEGLYEVLDEELVGTGYRSSERGVPVAAAPGAGRGFAPAGRRSSTCTACRWSFGAPFPFGTTCARCAGMMAV